MSAHSLRAVWGGPGEGAGTGRVASTNLLEEPGGRERVLHLSVAVLPGVCHLLVEQPALHPRKEQRMSAASTRGSPSRLGPRQVQPRSAQETSAAANLGCRTMWECQRPSLGLCRSACESECMWCQRWFLTLHGSPGSRVQREGYRVGRKIGSGRKTGLADRGSLLQAPNGSLPGSPCPQVSGCPQERECPRLLPPSPPCSPLDGVALKGQHAAVGQGVLNPLRGQGQGGYTQVAVAKGMRVGANNPTTSLGAGVGSPWGSGSSCARAACGSSSRCQACQ